LTITLSLSTSALAFKPEQTTLYEQIDRAQLVCVVEITKAVTPFSGKILQILKAPESFSQEAVTFETVSLRPQDTPHLNIGDKKLILLRRNTEKKWEVAAYGAQAIWPKSEKVWPYSEGHVSSLKEAVAAVKVLSGPDDRTDKAVRSLVASPVPLHRLAGLEILARSESLVKYPLATAEAMNKKNDPQSDVSRLATVVSSKLESKKPE